MPYDHKAYMKEYGKRVKSKLNYSVSVTEKECSECEELKNSSDFYTDKRNKSGLQSRCKCCFKLHQREYGARYKKNYPEKHNAVQAKRRAVKLRASPKWLSEEQKESIDSLYWLAKDLEVVSGQKYHVDHIVPLQGATVSGLHVPWNLQILPDDMNYSKGNNYA